MRKTPGARPGLKEISAPPGAAPWASTTLPVDLDAAHRVAVEAAEVAGALIRDGARGGVAAQPKGHHGDVTTRLDLDAERVIVDRIRAAFPQHRVVAEESGLHEGTDDALVWLVDPLDGTNNIAIGMAVYVVGIALCVDRVPHVGVVHDPVAERTWSAVRGAGAHGPGGGRLAATRRPVHPDRLVLAWTQGHGVPRDDPDARALKFVLDARARRVLPLWAPLVGWAMLARGDIDGFVGYQAEEIDLPAGALLAAEAGIVLLDLGGKAFDPRIGREQRERGFVAARADAVEPLLAMVREAESLAPRLAALDSAPTRLTGGLNGTATMPQGALPAWPQRTI